MRCQEIMRKPVQFCQRENTVEVAARKMKESGIGFLPICDAGGKVLGVLTDRDITVRVCAESLSPQDTAVATVMTHEVVACRPTDDILEAERLMAEKHTSRVLVTDEDQRMIGVISLADLAKNAPEGAVETLRAVASREVLDDQGRITSS